MDFKRNLLLHAICSICLTVVVITLSMKTTHAYTEKSENQPNVNGAVTVFGKAYDLRHCSALDGTFTLTAYNLDRQSTGKSPGDPAYGITASGTGASTGRTVAVDPRIIPYGSLLYIDGLGWRIAEDTGGAIHGHHIDVLVDSRRTAMQFGVKHDRRVEVFITPGLATRAIVTASGNLQLVP